MNAFPILQSTRCVMSCITDEDISVMQQIFDDDLTRKFLPELIPLVRTDKGIRQMLSSLNALFTQDEGIIWAIRLENTVIGFAAVMDLTDSPTILYAIHPNYRQKGYMKECIDVIINYILDKTQCSYIQSEVYIENTPSMHLLQSIGFKVKKKYSRKVLLRRELK